MKKVLSLILGNVLVFLVLALVLEGVLFLLYIYPFRPTVLAAARDYHLGFERLNPMYLPQCAKYDPDMTYRFLQSGCRFESREFANDIKVNKLGLRDDDASREGPDLIVLGDSHAFGWGVEGDEAFPSLLEKMTGRLVLNAAIPSFGTVRELRMFKRANRTAVKDVVIQYSENDREETASFVAAENWLAIMPEEAYLGYSPRYQEERRKYYPGKFIRRFLPALAIRFRRGMSEPDGLKYGTPRDIRREVHDFLQVIHYSPAKLDKVRLWVTEISAFNENSPDFLSILQEEFDKLPPERKAEVGGFHTIDLTPVLKDEHYYRYDDHLNAAGHRIVAETIAAAMAKETTQ